MEDVIVDEITLDQLEYAEHETMGQLSSLSELMFKNRGYPLTKNEVKESFDKKLINRLVRADLIHEALVTSFNNYGGRSGLRSCFIMSDQGNKYCQKFFPNQVVF